LSYCDNAAIGQLAQWNPRGTAWTPYPRIAEAWVTSPVPAEPEGLEALDAWLVETRAARV
jgi:hypothetical protein